MSLKTDEEMQIYLFKLKNNITDLTYFENILKTHIINFNSTLHRDCNERTCYFFTQNIHTLDNGIPNLLK